MYSYTGTFPDDRKLPVGVAMKTRRVKRARKERISQTDVLLIDEISMVSNFQFQRLSLLMEKSLHDGYGVAPPFGGIQVVVTGDVS